MKRARASAGSVRAAPTPRRHDMSSPLARVPIGHQLMQLLYLPIGELQLHARWQVEETTTLAPAAQAVLAEQLLDGVLNEYFVDAEGRHLQEIAERFAGLNTGIVELRYLLHRLVVTTTGPLVPSYVYRFQIQGDTLHLTPTLPTLEDYERRIHAMSDPDEGWVPARHRR